MDHAVYKEASAGDVDRVNIGQLRNLLPLWDNQLDRSELLWKWYLQPPKWLPMIHETRLPFMYACMYICMHACMYACMLH